MLQRKLFGLRRLFQDLDFEQMQPTTVFEDNKAAIALATNAGQNPKVKHIATRFHYTRDAVCDRKINIVYCNTNLMVADMFTKALAKELFLELRGLLGLTSSR